MAWHYPTIYSATATVGQESYKTCQQWGRSLNRLNKPKAWHFHRGVSYPPCAHGEITWASISQVEHAFFFLIHSSWVSEKTRKNVTLWDILSLWLKQLIDMFALMLLFPSCFSCQVPQRFPIYFSTTLRRWWVRTQGLESHCAVQTQWWQFIEELQGQVVRRGCLCQTVNRWPFGRQRVCGTDCARWSKALYSLAHLNGWFSLMRFSETLFL